MFIACVRVRARARTGYLILNDLNISRMK